MKNVDRCIEVKVDEGGFPIAIRWGTWRKVLTAEQWLDAGCWWEGEVERTFFRVETEGGHLLEIFRPRSGGAWRLYRVYD